MSNALEREGVIRSGHVFAWTVRLQGLSHRLEAGTYRQMANSIYPIRSNDCELH